MSRISVIIPSWNRVDLVRSVLASLRNQTRQPDQIIIVDNGSTDDSVAVARDLGAEVLSLAKNIGFAAAVNRGIAHTSGEWVVILNNDVLLAPDWIGNIVASTEQGGAEFAVGKLLQNNSQGTVDGSWDLVSRGGYAWRCGFGRPDGPEWSMQRQILMAPMTAAMFKRSVFERIGLLESGFESYYEDVDFGLRCAVAGLAGLYEPRAVATHMGKSTLGKSSDRIIRLSSRNQVLLLAKHYSAKSLRRFWWPVLVAQLLSIVAFARHGYGFAAIQGKWQGLKLWSTFRDLAPANAEAERRTEQIFSLAERQIFDLQARIGFDPYWRLYFMLVKPV